MKRYKNNLSWYQRNRKNNNNLILIRLKFQKNKKRSKLLLLLFLKNQSMRITQKVTFPLLVLVKKLKKNNKLILQKIKLKKRLWIKFNKSRKKREKWELTIQAVMKNKQKSNNIKSLMILSQFQISLEKEKKK